jgi:coenzyme F420-reducing hydrogenase alpha subunit
MQTITLEPLRWQDDPSRITVRANDTHVDVYYQVTSPKSVETICCGRPVEELPRILPILAPAHHLTAALALDRLFQVEPPELAQNMRTALLQAQYCAAHLRKIFFLLTSQQDPFADFHRAGRGAVQSKVSKRILESIMHHAALAQEAEDILGGRRDHPLSAVAGGVSRYLKEGHYDRLAEISDALLPFAQEMAELMRTEILSAGGMLASWSDVEIPALTGLHLAAGGQPTLTDPKGGGAQQLNGEQLGDTIAMQVEDWTYQPFAYLQSKGWQGLEQSQSLFHVGPLARFNSGQEAATPLAEEERQRIIECLGGAPPSYKLNAAFGALAVELVQAAELLQIHGSQESLTGPTLRNIPTTKGDSTWAVLEAPQGLMWHQYQVDGDGIVQSIRIIDAHTANNGIKCLLAKQLVTAAMERKQSPAAMKERASVALLPF